MLTMPSTKEIKITEKRLVSVFFFKKIVQLLTDEKVVSLAGHVINSLPESVKPDKVYISSKNRTKQKQHYAVLQPPSPAGEGKKVVTKPNWFVIFCF